ncbi:MAG: aminotransferase class IV [Dermatophilaceae bacterium]
MSARERAVIARVAVRGRGVLDADEPVLTGDDLGLIRGDGCFDSTRVVTNAEGVARAENLIEHLDRLAASAAELEIYSPSHSEWIELIDGLLAAWDTPGEAVLKVILTRGREWDPGPPTAIATLVDAASLAGVGRAGASVPSCALGTGTGGSDTSAPRGPWAARRGIKIVTLSKGHPSDAYVDAPWLLGGVKTLSYVVNVSAQREARRRGADDVLFTTTDGYCLDGPTSGLIVIDGDRLRTTTTGPTGLLASVTVERTVEAARGDGMEARYELIPVGDLLCADGVWLVSSSRGAAPVTHVDGVPIAVDPALVERITRYAGFALGS